MSKPFADAPMRPFTPPRRGVPVDLRGGVAAATMTLVTAVSYAALAGAPLGPTLAAATVLSGLLGASLGGAAAALTGAAPGLVFSPRASVAVVIAAALSHIIAHASGPGSTPAVLVWLVACLLCAALLQLGFGVFKLGALIRLIPHAVTAGFTVGIALQIALSQLPYLFNAGSARGLAWSAPLAVGLATVAAVAWAHRCGRSGWALPAGVVAGLVMQAALETLWHGLALPHLPSINLHATPVLSPMGLWSAMSGGAWPGQVPSLVGFAFVIAFVNSIETLTAAVVIEELGQRRVDANRALIAGAVGSLAALCAGGLPVAASAAASVASVKAGARSSHAALIAAALLTLFALLGGQALAFVPLAVVAGLMLTVACALVQAPLQELVAQRGQQPSPFSALSGDIAVAALVCGLVLTTGIATAVIAGVVAAAALWVRQTRRTLVRRQYDASGPEAAALMPFALETGMARRIQVVEVAQPLFFATAETVMQVLEELPRGTRFAILDLSHVSAIDATATRLLARCSASLRLRNRELLLVRGAPGPALATGWATHEPCCSYADLGQALGHAARRCQQEAQSQPDFVPDAVPASFWSRKLNPMIIAMRGGRPTVPGKPQTQPPLDPQVVSEAARALAHYLGPVAQLLARRAASQCADVAALYQMLAQELHVVAEREDYLRGMPTLAAAQTGHRAELAAPALVAVADAALGVSLASQVLEQATSDLMRYLGPISKLLVKRAQRKAVDREHLYHLLARQLGTVVEREAFLRDAGVAPLANSEGCP
jgi:sulfate permease, SulP family